MTIAIPKTPVYNGSSFLLMTIAILGSSFLQTTLRILRMTIATWKEFRGESKMINGMGEDEYSVRLSKTKLLSLEMRR